MDDRCIVLVPKVKPYERTPKVNKSDTANAADKTALPTKFDKLPPAEGVAVTEQLESLLERIATGRVEEANLLRLGQKVAGVN
jgi:hypothetical protein